jgi:Fe-S-cluster containining protein
MPSVLCEHCTAVCCRYIALPIDTPTARPDFDDIRWYLLHENVQVFVEDGDWYLYIATQCRHLQPDFRCGIYEHRPSICRKYTTDNCDYHSGDYGWEHHFTCPEHLDEYVRLHFRSKSRKGVEKRRGKGRTRPRLRVKLRPLALTRAQRENGYAAATTDVRGIALPILGAAR